MDDLKLEDMANDIDILESEDAVKLISLPIGLISPSLQDKKELEVCGKSSTRFSGSACRDDI